MDKFLLPVQACSEGEINPSSRVDYINFITKHSSLLLQLEFVFQNSKNDFLIYLNNDF